MAVFVAFMLLSVRIHNCNAEATGNRTFIPQGEVNFEYPVARRLFKKGGKETRRRMSD